ncbi:hypothetical protein BKA63DRAFT_62075 [Paraphoma chrysanthemicola]|nr:hypothetical protein BKA63DRAFT_62075 [Paraphoma chrysanthemicola]
MALVRRHLGAAEKPKPRCASQYHPGNSRSECCPLHRARAAWSGAWGPSRCAGDSGMRRGSGAEDECFVDVMETVIDTPTPRDTCTARRGPLRAVKPNMAGTQAPRPSASPDASRRPSRQRISLHAALDAARCAMSRHPGSRRGPWMSLLGRRPGLERQPRQSLLPVVWSHLLYSTFTVTTTGAHGCPSRPALPRPSTSIAFARNARTCSRPNTHDARCGQRPSIKRVLRLAGARAP